MIGDNQILAGAIGLAGSLSVLGLAGLTLLKRPETASLFVEDREGYVVVKVLVGVLLAVVGTSGFVQALDFLLRR